MVERLLHLLLTQTIVLSFAVVGVTTLQAATRRFGAGAAYAAWLLVPVAMLAAAVPHPTGDAMAVRVDVSAIGPNWVAAPVMGRAADRNVAMTAVGLAWVAGAALLAGLLVQRQRRFESLVLAPSSGAAPALPAGAGPAVLGVWRRRIVLPRDFHSAFDAEERRLMLVHEGVHLRRADNAWNLLASALLVAHWFNPVAWWAWRRLRVDQETSCDAAVLRREAPDALSTYVGALLKVQGVALAPPLATSWHSPHPLVERVRMLQVHRISSARHRAGLRIAALAVVLAGTGGYALQAGAGAPPAASDAAVMTAVEVRVDAGAAIAARLLTQAGQTATLRVDPDAKHALKAPVEIAYTVTRLDGNRLQLDTTLRQGTPLSLIGSPRLVTHDGEAARVSVRTQDGAHEVAVSFKPQLMTGALPALPPVPPVPPVPPTSALAPLPPLPASDALPALPAPPAPGALQPMPPMPAPLAPAALPPLPVVPPPPAQRAY